MIFQGNIVIENENRKISKNYKEKYYNNQILKSWNENQIAIKESRHDEKNLIITRLNFY
jgi:hypothetical protein